jgi:hypothetical protein
MSAPRVRRWAVRPDTSIYTEAYGEIPCVTRDAVVRAIMDGESLLAVTGGILKVMVGRHPTDLPGEAVTTHAVLEWKDGPRATLDDEEPVSSVLPAQPEPEPEIVEPAPITAANIEVDEDNPDGLELGDEEEDVTAMEPAR